MHHSDSLLAAKLTEERSLHSFILVATDCFLSVVSGCLGFRNNNRSAMKKKGSISRAVAFFLCRFLACLTLRLISTWTMFCVCLCIRVRVRVRVRARELGNETGRDSAN